MAEEEPPSSEPVLPYETPPKRPELSGSGCLVIGLAFGIGAFGILLLFAGIAGLLYLYDHRYANELNEDLTISVALVFAGILFLTLSERWRRAQRRSRTWR